MSGYRYRVIGTWGKVPPQIAEIEDEDDAYLVYPEYRGVDSSQSFLQDGEVVGGWAMQYAGERSEPAEVKP
jgi:hypothetical protein